METGLAWYEGYWGCQLGMTVCEMVMGRSIKVFESSL